jgi:sigma-B regulation protein RsbU (phosphoserine phosphatase)
MPAIILRLLGIAGMSTIFIELNQNIALGVLDDFEFTAGEMKLNPGDRIVLYTDGITEAFNPKGEVFSEERLLSTIIDSGNANNMQLIQQIQQEIKNFALDAEQSDDITILAITYNGIK